MIRKETDNGWILFNQHDHAKLAAEIMEFWGNGDFTTFSPFDEVLFAIEQHDNGWKEWDSHPQVNQGNNYPMNFMEMELDDQHDIWRKCFSNHADEHPYASALIALHFRKFNCKSISKTPSNGKAVEMKNEIDRFIVEKLGLEHFDSVDTLPQDILLNLRFLQIGDIISLTLCHGWNSMKIDNVPTDYDGSSCKMILNSDNGGRYNISPDPFCRDSMEFRIRGRRINRREFESDEQMREMINDTEYENFSYIIEIS